MFNSLSDPLRHDASPRAALSGTAAGWARGLGKGREGRAVRTSGRRGEWGEGGFTLIELVITVSIIALLGAVAASRLGRATGRAEGPAVAANLTALRRAVELYQAEHGRYPTLIDIKGQLTRHTDEAGTVSASRTSAARFGPYLKTFPAFKRGRSEADVRVVALSASNADWVYNEATGEIRASGNGKDEAGRLYSSY